MGNVKKKEIGETGSEWAGENALRVSFMLPHSQITKDYSQCETFTLNAYLYLNHQRYR